MSAVGKMPLTKIEISEGRRRKLYLVSREAGHAVSTLLEGFRGRSEEGQDGWIDASALYPDLKDPVKRAATVFHGIRLRHGLTQKEMGKKLGLHQTDVSKIEKGERRIGRNLAVRIGKALGIDYRRFL